MNLYQRVWSRERSRINNQQMTPGKTKMYCTMRYYHVYSFHESLSYYIAYVYESGK